MSRATRAIVDGQVVDDIQVIASGVPCRLTSPNSLIGNRQLYGLSEKSARPRVCYFEPGYDVRKDDRLLVNDGNYRVLDAEDHPDGIYRSTSLEILA